MHGDRTLFRGGPTSFMMTYAPDMNKNTVSYIFNGTFESLLHFARLLMHLRTHSILQFRSDVAIFCAIIHLSMQSDSFQLFREPYSW